ncbi:MAG TPA: hydroxyacid dehydrogenase [Candidatus Methylacidiphilales bacterium]
MKPWIAAYLLADGALEKVYGERERASIERLLGSPPLRLIPEDVARPGAAWPEVELLFSGWGMPRVDAAFLARFPRLRAIFYGAGSVKVFATPAMWERGIRVTTAASANAVPVGDFALSQILFSLKWGWRNVFSIRAHGCFPQPEDPPGIFRSVVALLSFGAIGRLVAERLRAFDVRVIGYDPFISDGEMAQLGVERVSLEEAFECADVVSCHMPLLRQTERLIGGRHFESMKPGATFLNTARGGVVDEASMIEVLRRRPDLTAVLDVTDPEPPVPGSPLYAMENVILTPHIAGSMGRECERMGAMMAEELERYMDGRPLLFEIDAERAASAA